MTIQATYTSTTSAFRLTTTPATGSAFPLIDPSALGSQPTAAFLQATTANIRFTTDGSTPTASHGAVLVAGNDPFLYAGPLTELRFIRESAGAILEVVYGTAEDTVGAQGPPGPAGTQGPPGTSTVTAATINAALEGATLNGIRVNADSGPSFDGAPTGLLLESTDDAPWLFVFRNNTAGDDYAFTGYIDNFGAFNMSLRNPNASGNQQFGFIPEGYFSPASPNIAQFYNSWLVAQYQWNTYNLGADFQAFIDAGAIAAFGSSNLAGGDAAHPYFLWYGGTGTNAGVWRVNELGIQAYYNPSFATYTPGGADFERIVQQWNADVAEIGTEKGGTGTLRPLRLLGPSVDATAYKVGGVAGLASFSGAVTNITVVNGIVTAAS